MQREVWRDQLSPLGANLLCIDDARLLLAYFIYKSMLVKPNHLRERDRIWRDVLLVSLN